ncbi:O-antigen ligase family protein [Thalassotalea atypica]|uniref:O-antigen ligase family protein n=1 Tax=Thalassotalea atypica TaxID=2054316 RepID=UPI002573F718|nr:O-antigen ligase family protein [Thalassotalea atypica]
MINPNPDAKIRSLKLAICQLTFLMLGVTLLVDSVNGFFLSGMGIDPKLSAMFKLTLLFLVLLQVGAESKRALAYSLTILIFFLVGPVITLVDTLDAAGFIDDFTSSLKILTALFIFVYCCLMADKWPVLTEKYGQMAIKFGFLILLSNIILGVLGFGFSSYGGAEDGDNEEIGVKGFFYAGNEVSGIFIVLFGVILHLLWIRSRRLYFLFAPIAMVCGLLIATKAAMLAGVAMVFAIPLFNERNKLLNLTWLKLKMAFPLIVVGIILAVVLLPVFEATGLLGRFMWFYEKKGIIGILLSGRDEFVVNMMQVFEHHTNLLDYVFGLSKTGLGLLTKNAMEIDPIDMYLWHGLPGLLFFLVNATIFLRVSYLATRIPTSTWGPSVLVINLILIGVSVVAGHIFTSGMLAPLLGLVNGMAYIDLVNQRRRLCKSPNINVAA